jgi:hypothetical protein
MEKALSEEMEPFAEKIREADVTTTAGLRAKALVAVWDIRVGRLTHSEGVAFILESGHQNNPEAEQVFHDVRRFSAVLIRHPYRPAMTERKQLKREPKMKAELYEMLAEAVRSTQLESKRPPKAKRAKKP